MADVQRASRMPVPRFLACLITAIGLNGTVAAQTWSLDETPPRFSSYSDFGGVGLLQMPSARMAPDGEFAVSSGVVTPYVRTAVTLQALPGLEAVLRYTSVNNRLYGPESFSGDQSYKDKGIDVKFRLLEESSAFPQLVVGFRDVAGTGLFSSEYVALSRRYFNLDFTLGMGWGNIAGRGTFKNPLGVVFSSFKTRSNDFGRGGNFSITNYFHGEYVSLFGGVTWQTPVKGLSLKLEYDGNNYQQEALGNVFPVHSPFNIGAVYSLGDWLDLSIGYERGNTLMATLAVRGNIHSSAGLPKFDPPPERIQPRNLAAEVASARQARRDAAIGDPQLRLATALRERNYSVEHVEIRGKEAIAAVSQKTFRNKAKAMGRAARVMANAVPPEVEALTLVDVEKGLEIQRVTLMRKDLEKAVAYEGSPEEMAAHMTVLPPRAQSDEGALVNKDQYPAWNWGMNPQMRHQIGGPDSPYFYQVYLKVDGDLQLSRKLSVSGSLGFNLIDNFDRLILPSDSVLPHVRSDIKDYLREGKTGITRLQADYLTNLGSSWYGRASAGLFEEMFGGVSGELLYRPLGSRWALGFELNRVRQRAYDQRFSFRDYEVTTGHVDWYYKLPFYNVTTKVSAGQYLAGDRGVTVDVSRRFDSGAVFGVFATKTNVSADQFGEGSFDKGAYISVPVDLLSVFSSRSSFGMGWRPLTRDGGQRLSVSKGLYGIVSGAGRDELLADWSKVLE